MTQEEKELLLKDLCGRLLYGVRMKGVNEDFELSTSASPKRLSYVLNSADFKPYLRPMSSMTEEERKELSDYLCEQVMSNKIGITIPPNPTQGKGIPFIWMGDCLDWLNEHHFDYRGLIEKGFALEAPEGMYEIK